MIKILSYTSFALVAFAFNSILCRMALRGGEADEVGFTAVRLLSGAVVLSIICLVTGEPVKFRARNVDSGISLFVYAFLFSLAYLELTAGVGALILFGSVQLTMVGVSIFKREWPRPLEWLGLVVAVAGLVYLVFPSLTAPPLFSSILMAGAGAAWGIYTLRGKGSKRPLSDTTVNFFVAFAAMLVVLIFESWSEVEMSRFGVLLAVLSGGVASGIGYTVWYAVLKDHTATRAAVLQLAVPVIAAFGGVLLLSEVMSTRLLVAAALILGGIGMTIAGRKA